MYETVTWLWVVQQEGSLGHTGSNSGRQSRAVRAVRAVQPQVWRMAYGRGVKEY